MASAGARATRASIKNPHGPLTVTTTVNDFTCTMFAEFEREMIRERVAAGLARAKAHGTKSGNPIGRPAVGDDIEQRIRELRAEGLGMVKVAKLVGCGVSVVQRVDVAAWPLAKARV